MKTSILKKILPIAVIMLAIAGAFASQPSNNRVLAPKLGYIDSATPCSVEVSCNTTVGEICTQEVNSEEKQAFGKVNPNDASCAQVLYRN